MLINSLLRLLQLHICVLEKLCHINQKVLKRPRKVLENRSTFEMYLSTSIRDFSEMFLITFQVVYKVQMYYKVLLPGSDHYSRIVFIYFLVQSILKTCSFQCFPFNFLVYIIYDDYHKCNWHIPHLPHIPHIPIAVSRFPQVQGNLTFLNLPITFTMDQSQIVFDSANNPLQ